MALDQRWELTQNRILANIGYVQPEKHSCFKKKQIQRKGEKTLLLTVPQFLFGQPFNGFFLIVPGVFVLRGSERKCDLWPQSPFPRGTPGANCQYLWKKDRGKGSTSTMPWKKTFFALKTVINHPKFGNGFYIPPIKMVNLGDGLWYWFTRITMIWRGRRTIILQQMGNEILNAISTCRFRGDQDRSVKAWCYDPMEFMFLLSIER